jgi:Glycosyl hydrolase family 47
LPGTASALILASREDPDRRSLADDLAHRNGHHLMRRRQAFRIAPALLLAPAVLGAGCSGTEPASQAVATTVPDVRPVHAADGLTTDTAFAAEVKEAYLHAWEGYVKYAWGHDALKPLSGGYRDWYSSPLLMTPVDGYDTMLLMGLTQQADSAKSLILDHLSFDDDMNVQVFEVTIRLLGGLLSAYQLDGNPRFLELATDLGDRLLPAFDSRTGMPYVYVNLSTGAPSDSLNNPAEIGTLTLEFGTLSRVTGDPKYMAAAKKGVTQVYDRRSRLGLVGTIIDVNTGKWKNTGSHVGGRIDSYYEYLLKSWLLFDDADFQHMWETSRDAMNKYVADTVNGHLWYGSVDMNTGKRNGTTSGALQAYLPAVLALGGDLPRAERLMGSEYLMWTTFGVEPEEFDYTTMKISYPQYPLRPESIESAYYLYTLTGDEKWRDMGRDMFHRIVKATRVSNGFADLKDVRTGEQDDAMESFFLAETLKYSYLLANPSALDFDHVVFNTEAHPLHPVPKRAG